MPSARDADEPRTLPGLEAEYQTDTAGVLTGWDWGHLGGSSAGAGWHFRPGSPEASAVRVMTCDGGVFVETVVKLRWGDRTGHFRHGPYASWEAFNGVSALKRASVALWEVLGDFPCAYVCPEYRAIRRGERVRQRGGQLSLWETLAG